MPKAYGMSPEDAGPTTQEKISCVMATIVRLSEGTVYAALITERKEAEWADEIVKDLENLEAGTTI